MEENPNNLNEENCDVDRKFFEEAGSSRAVTSGSLSMMFAMIGSSGVWLFLIIATGWDGLQYFGLTQAINGIVGIFGIGFSRSFIAEIKEAQVINEDLAHIKALTYSRIFFLIGLIMGGALISISFFTENELLRTCYLASGIWTIISYIQTVFSVGLEVRNRYDIIASLSIFGGISLLIGGLLFISFNWNPRLFAFYPLFNISTFFLFLYFFHKHSSYKLNDILRADLNSKKMKKNSPQDVQELIKDDQVTCFLKSSVFSMITNMESLGIFGNILIYFAAIFIMIIEPQFQGLAVSILTIVMTYGAVKTIILYYSGPLNIELSEACARDKHKTIEDSVNNSTRVSSILALAFVVGMIAFSRDLLLMLHESFFITDNGSFDSELFLTVQVLFILVIIGQFSYGYATLFGNALIGSGNARYAALGFGLTLVIILIITPFCIFSFSILGVGIAMIISAGFLLPYMTIQLKRKLQIHLHFKMGRIAPNLLIMFLILWLIPLDGLIGFSIKLIIGGFVYMLLNPFFGVSLPEDIQMINDLFKTIKMKPMGTFLAYSMKGMYNISPFNKDKITLK